MTPRHHYHPAGDGDRTDGAAVPGVNARLPPRVRTTLQAATRSYDLCSGLLRTFGAWSRRERITSPKENR
jgi:hypothetical protein